MSNKTQVLCNNNIQRTLAIKEYWKIIKISKIELLEIENEEQQIIKSSKEPTSILWDQPKGLTNIQWVQLANLNIRRRQLNRQITLNIEWIKQTESELIIC